MVEVDKHVISTDNFCFGGFRGSGIPAWHDDWGTEWGQLLPESTHTDSWAMDKTSYDSSEGSRGHWNVGTSDEGTYPSNIGRMAWSYSSNFVDRCRNQWREKGFLVIHGCRYPVKLLVGKFARWRFLKPGAEYLPFAKSFPSFKGTHIIVAGDQKGSKGYQLDSRL